MPRLNDAGKMVARFGVLALVMVGVLGCKKPEPAPPTQGPLPVMVAPVALTSVPSTESYVATIKSRRSATLSPQVDGNITKILVTSGQMVSAGQVLMTINPLKQLATVDQQVGSQAQANAAYQFNKAEVERQKKLFDAGITSRQAYDTAGAELRQRKGRVRCERGGYGDPERATGVLPDSGSVCGCGGGISRCMWGTM